jgi:NodT family efflux transporter outer membrane factor (OMF) lipoprotein
MSSAAARLIVAFSLASLAGCDLVPAYEPLSPAVPALFKSPQPAPGGRLGDDWPRAFGSAELDRLMARFDAENPTLAAAEARFKRAQATLDLANSAFSPQVSLQPSLSDNKQSNDRPLRSKSQPNYYGANQILGQLTWELDLWGRVQNNVNAAQAGAEASRDQFDAIRTALRASLARAYIALRGADAQTALLARTIVVYRAALALTQQRLSGHIAPPIDVERAKVQLANAQAAAAETAQARAVLENAVATLSGQPASEFRLAARPEKLSLPRLPRSAPSELLQRRPDVAAAERLLFAANQRIGAAKADFFPRFSLLLSGGTQDTGLNLTNLHNSLWSVGPSMIVPIFDGGAKQAVLEAARADFSAAAADYRASVLTAFEEVEDALASIRLLGQERAALAVAATAARRAEDMTTNLYKDGAASSLDLVTAQSAALDAQRAQIAVETRLLQQYVALSAALGGGWSGPAPAPKPAEAPALALLGPKGQDPALDSQAREK